MAIMWSGPDKQFVQVDGRCPDRVAMDLIDGLLDETFHVYTMRGYMSGNYGGDGRSYIKRHGPEEHIGYHIANARGNWVAELVLELIENKHAEWYRTDARLLFMVPGNYHRPNGVTGYYQNQLDISHDAMTLLWETCAIIIEQHQLVQDKTKLAEAETQLWNRLSALRAGRSGKQFDE